MEKKTNFARRFFLCLLGLGLGGVLLFLGAGLDRFFNFKFLDQFQLREKPEKAIVDQRVLEEESGVIEVVETVGPAVVTVRISKMQVTGAYGFRFGPFELFDPSFEGEEEEIEENIGSGFVIDAEGLVVTNKHVVSDMGAGYQVITNEDKVLEVEKIYRDPANDLAILKVKTEGAKLTPAELGDSDKLKVGQFVIAIGTALGEFKNTVTTGVVSGLGRGITAGSPYESYVEEIDDVIQTDAAISPGNSGGPLLNGLGQVVGVNVAVAAQGENIAFAIPINIVKASLENFKQTGEFSRPFLGIRYEIIDQETGIMQKLPQGAYLMEVIKGSPAEKAGLKEGEVITKFDGKELTEEEEKLATLINRKKVGDRVKLEVWRKGETREVSLVLEEMASE